MPRPRRTQISLERIIRIIELAEDTGRIIRNDKRGYISENSGELLTRLNITHDNWLKLTTEFGKLFHGPVGTL